MFKIVERIRAQRDVPDQQVLSAVLGHTLKIPAPPQNWNGFLPYLQLTGWYSRTRHRNPASVVEKLRLFFRLYFFWGPLLK